MPQKSTDDAHADEPHRVQLRRAKGWRMPPSTVKVDRTTRWGNHAGAGISDKAQSVAAFKHWLDTEATLEWKIAARAALLGKNLACWCKQGGPCHADLLLRWLKSAS
jgi:hypothetical protein